MTFKPLTSCIILALVVTGALLTAPFASAAKSPIRVGIADQSPRMFDSPAFQALNVKRTRYFVPADVMRDSAERAKARAFAIAARDAGVSVLLHISTTDLREKRGPRRLDRRLPPRRGRLVVYFRKLGVRDFGSWNEVNHKTQETWDRVGNAVVVLQGHVHGRQHAGCPSCARRRPRRPRPGRRRQVHGELLQAPGCEMAQASRRRRHPQLLRRQPRAARRARRRSSGPRASSTSARSSGSPRPARSRASARRFGTPSRARPRGCATCSATRAATATLGVERVYSYNWFGIENGSSCGSRCLFDAGLVDPDGTTRPVYDVFKSQLRNYSR